MITINIYLITSTQFFIFLIVVLVYFYFQVYLDKQVKAVQCQYAIFDKER